MVNKRGSSMATSTIVLLVIAILILVVLILGFTKGWKSLVPWIEQGNLKTVKGSCNVACATNGEFSFCSKKVDVNDGETDNFESTCYELSMNPAYSKYGIDPCPGLC